MAVIVFHYLNRTRQNAPNSSEKSIIMRMVIKLQKLRYSSLGLFGSSVSRKMM
ncbi:MAG: hypothetical protein L3J33_09985 [Rhodobacteraceae bacterium]|nr:hypothetical protein [Paracoccaceae bacterium]